MNIIRRAFQLVEAVTGLAGRARRFYYAVVLLGRRCGACGGRLAMVAESRARCRRCGRELDPTVAFQRCTHCGGKPHLRIRRYVCRTCGRDVASRFVFDGLVFDAAYFRAKMAESRQRKKQLRDRVREMLIASRSEALQLPSACDLGSVPGLLAALNGLTAGACEALSLHTREDFDLRRYQAHIRAHLGDFPIGLGQIPPLGKEARKDRIWRFVAVVFLAHHGVIDIWQEDADILVRKHEADGEGQDIPGDLEAVDRIERSLGRAEA